MNILIIGGTGFIGPNVVRLLHAAGHQITLYHRGQTETKLPEAVTHIRGGWTAELPQHQATFRQLAPDVVLAMRPLGSTDAQQIVDTFAGIAGRVVGISSGDVYRAYGRFQGSESGPPEPMPLTEEAPLREKRFPYRQHFAADPDHPLYQYDKILAEEVLMGRPALPGTILRLPFVYGPGDQQHRFYSHVRRMADGRPALIMGQGFAGWRGTAGFVANVAAAISLAITHDAATGRIYNVGEWDVPTQAERAQTIGDVFGWQGQIVTAPEEELPAHLASPGNWAQQMVMDTTRFRRELGFAELVPPTAALKQTIAWELQHTPADDDGQLDYGAEDAFLATLHEGA